MKKYLCESNLLNYDNSDRHNNLKYLYKYFPWQTIKKEKVNKNDSMKYIPKFIIFMHGIVYLFSFKIMR